MQARAGVLAAAVISAMAAATASSAADAAEDGRNCFHLLDEEGWRKVVEHDRAQAKVIFRASAEPQFAECLLNQEDASLAYQLRLMRTTGTNSEEEQEVMRSTPEKLLREDVVGNATFLPEFRYLVLRGSYRIMARACQLLEENSKGISIACEEEDNEDDDDDDKEQRVAESGVIAQLSSNLLSASCLGKGGSNSSSDSQRNGKVLRTWAEPETQGTLVFTFLFESCMDEEDEEGALPYETASVFVIMKKEDQAPTVCDPNLPDNHVLAMVNVPVKSAAGALRVEHAAAGLTTGLTYCAYATLDTHPLCPKLDAGVASGPDFCAMRSPWASPAAKLPWADWLPYCATHLKCAWVYVTAACSVALALSCALAVCLVHCAKCRCCRKKKSKRRYSVEDPVAFDCLTTVDGAARGSSKRTWADVHSQWDTDPPKGPGKILLLYSPDTKLFRELQESLKSFLEVACHCIVLDLFDEDLFATIAYDPEAWLTNLLDDPDFKVIVIESQGAYKRYQSLAGKEVLNIPEPGALGGLFSAALAFFLRRRERADPSRLALARYETLPLSAGDFSLPSLAPRESALTREFLVPTELHEFFCWVHGHDPLDLLGKPWDRYHLELQLLTDALKRARRERPLE